MKNTILVALVFVLFTFGLSAQTTLPISPLPDGEVSNLSYALDEAQKTPEGRAALAMSTDAYPATPGDMYSLTFLTAGGLQNLVLIVEADYSVNLSNLGKFSAEGMSFERVKAFVSDKVLKSYPLSSPQLVVSMTGTFPVRVVGEVRKAAEYYAWGLTRLSKIANLSSTVNTSYRSIEIRDRKGIVRKFDLFAMERDGNFSQDPFLRPGDTVSFSRAERTVVISGAVERPGSYVLLPGENLKDLILRYGNGFTERADPTRLDLIRYVQASGSAGERRSIVYGDGSFQLQNRDAILVPTYQELLPVMFIEGAVGTGEAGANLEGARRITYQFYPGEDLSQAVRAKRGVFTEVSDIKNAYVVRDGNKLPVDIGKYLYDKDFTDSIPIEPNDLLIIPFKQYFVSVGGAVRSPGRYPYVPDRNWRYYVSLAGGIDEERNVGDTLRIRDIGDALLPMDAMLPPESKIMVDSNSFLYFFGRYAPVVTTILSVLTTTLSIIAVTGY